MAYNLLLGKASPTRCPVRREGGRQTIPSVVAITTIAGKDEMNQFINLDIIIWGIYAGISIAAFVSLAVQNVVSRTVMCLVENALSKENAKTAAELGLSKLERRVLRGQLYGKLIFCQNEYYVRTDGDKKQNPYKNPPLDMDRAKFYIPEELRFRAEVRYGERRPSLLGTAGGVVALGVAFALFRLAAPYLISIFTEAFS